MTHAPAFTPSCFDLPDPTKEPAWAREVRYNFRCRDVGITSRRDLALRDAGRWRWAVFVPASLVAWWRRVRLRRRFREAMQAATLWNTTALGVMPLWVSAPPRRPNVDAPAVQP